MVDDALKINAKVFNKNKGKYGLQLQLALEGILRQYYCKKPEIDPVNEVTFLEPLRFYLYQEFITEMLPSEQEWKAGEFHCNPDIAIKGDKVSLIAEVKYCPLNHQDERKQRDLEKQLSTLRSIIRHKEFTKITSEKIILLAVLFHSEQHNVKPDSEKVSIEIVGLEMHENYKS